MPTIKVRPIDLSEKGSYKLRKRILRIGADMEGGSVAAVTDGLAALEAVLADRLIVEDGTSIADVIEELSVTEFNELIAAIVGGGATAVPPVKSVS